MGAALKLLPTPQRAVELWARYRFWHWHRWTKWQRGQRPQTLMLFGVPSREVIAATQERECVVCGRTEVEAL